MRLSVNVIQNSRDSFDIIISRKKGNIWEKLKLIKILKEGEEVKIYNIKGGEE